MPSLVRILPRLLLVYLKLLGVIASGESSQVVTTEPSERAA